MSRVAQYRLKGGIRSENWTPRKGPGRNGRRSATGIREINGKWQMANGKWQMFPDPDATFILKLETEESPLIRLRRLRTMENVKPIKGKIIR